MKHLKLCIALLVICLGGFAWAPCHAQTNQRPDCFEVKYLDFFGIPDKDTLFFSSGDLDKSFSEFRDMDKEGKKALFVLPLILHQLKYYYPACSQEHDTAVYNKLLKLYFIIKKQDMSVLKGKTKTEQMEYIRQDFYALVDDPKVFINMIFTFDDGPFFGVDTTSKPNPATDKTIETDFGRLVISQAKNSVSLIAYDHKGNLLWARAMKDSRNENLEKLEFTDKSIDKSSAAYTIRIHTNEDNIWLYLKPDGRFVGYFQHW